MNALTTAKESLIKDLNKSINNIREEQRKLDEEKNKNKLITDEKDKLQNDISKIRDSLAKIQENMRGKQAKIDNYIVKLKESQRLLEQTRKNEQIAQEERHRLDIQLSNLEGEIAEKEKLLKRAERELVESKQAVQMYKSQGFKITPAPATAVNNGQVVAVSNDSEVPIVMISLGLDDNVKKGQKFTVFRGSRYIGQVTIEEVYKDMSSARIVKKMTTRAIKRGDEVTIINIGG